MDDFTIEGFLEAKELGGRNAGSRAASDATLTAYEARLGLIERLAGKPLREMGEKDVDGVLRKLARNYSASTRNMTVTVGRQAFAWAIACGYYDGNNPFLNVGASKREEALPTIIPMDDVERILERVADVVGEPVKEKYQLAFVVQATSGVRISEVLGLRAMDLADGGVMVRGKGSKSRYVPLRPDVAERLRAYVAGRPLDAFVFQSDGRRSQSGAMSVSSFTRVFKRAVEAAGLDPNAITPHVLRHTFATHALRQTGRLEVVQDLLGHADPKTTRIYAKLTKDDLDTAYKNIWS